MDQKILRRIKQKDRLARWVITVGGMAIIASVILILLLIGEVSLPLFQEPKADQLTSFALPENPGDATVKAMDIDEYLETSVVLTEDGVFSFYKTASGSRFDQIALTPPAGEDGNILAVEQSAPMTFNVLWSDGSLTVEQVRFSARFDPQGNRSFVRQNVREASFPAPAEGIPARTLARIDDDGRQTRVDLLPGGRLKTTQISVETDMFDNEEISESTFFLDEAATLEITALTLDHRGHTLYAGTADGTLMRWSLSEAGSPVLLDRLKAFSDGRRITALAMVLGEISLAVGDEQGGLSTWFAVRKEAGSNGTALTRIHELTRHDSAVVAIVPSRRDKSLLSIDTHGSIHLDHMTSERHLLTLENFRQIPHVALSSRGNGIAALDQNGQMLLWSVDNPHPEISLKTLFGRVWYESYDKPALVWQSSSASDDFEPKLSLTPLIFGTLKGTFYAMIFAIPMAIYGAIYISQFGSNRLRQWIKPAVEIMAAIPSVVIGFLAALWFAPRLEGGVPALMLAVIFLPVSLTLSILLWQWLRSYKPLRNIERGYEFIAIAPVLILAIAASIILGPLVESIFFGGDFKLWLFNAADTRYDPRNSIVIAFALGFAVIPIIFTIAEDSLSNVPSSLKAASLALGASRWQTVWRVILPSASPGIFAGIMIGLGRAIGETMIVLMATGNTPIIDWSMFNGMRPLSSNIAVEIPEAPHGGTLYRVLFLSAVILFGFTFVLNTVAEVVRQRLRKKYGRF